MVDSAFTAVHKIKKNLKLQHFLIMGQDMSALTDAKHKAGSLALTHRWVHAITEYMKNNYSKSTFSHNTTNLLSIKVATCFNSRSHHQFNY
jgi:hypothetical protein